MPAPEAGPGPDFERRLYALAESVIRLSKLDQAERTQAVQTVYGRHIGYILKLLSEWAPEGDYADWPELAHSSRLEEQILARAKQHLAERQAKQLYR